MHGHSTVEQKEEAMSNIAAARGRIGYALAHDEGEAFWLLGMLQTIKIGRADTDGKHGLLEIMVPAGIGSPWHVHPEEDEGSTSSMVTSRFGSANPRWS